MRNLLIASKKKSTKEKSIRLLLITTKLKVIKIFALMKQPPHPQGVHLWLYIIAKKLNHG